MLVSEVLECRAVVDAVHGLHERDSDEAHDESHDAR